MPQYMEWVDIASHLIKAKQLMIEEGYKFHGNEPLSILNAKSELDGFIETILRRAEVEHFRYLRG